MIHIKEKEYNRLAEYVKLHYGVNLGNSKQMLVVGRLQQELLKANFRSFTEYYDHLTSDASGAAVIALVNRITTNYTFFMRETQHFDYMREGLLPQLVGNIQGRDLRIWSAGCSTGQEPYSLAMLIDEYLGREKMMWDTKILATDISMEALETAAKGEYGREQVEALPAGWRMKYFEPINDTKSVVVDRIRNEVIFRYFNLMERTYPFKNKFHAIFCRNVMIYFDEDTKHELVNKFEHVLEPGGCLFVGHAESLDRRRTALRNILPAVYRKE